jgi:hypothetical protein
MNLIPNRLAGIGLLAALAMPVIVTPRPLRAFEPSDPMGVYCLVDKVILEPAEAPERAQVWGVCALANSNDWYFQAPAAGYFYYTVPSARADAVRAEWQDLKSVAGTKEVVGFGRRYQPVGRLRPATETPASPDAYPLHLGVTKVGTGRFAPEVNEIVARIRAARGQ